MKKVVLSVFLFVTLLSAGAIEESSYGSVCPRQVRPWFEHAAKRGTLTTADGRTLSWLAVEARHERGAVVIVQGWTEQMALYDELLYDLRDSGYSFYLYDLRGQGRSEGDHPSDDRWYVKDWKSFVSDLDLFYTAIVRARPHPETVFLGYSMGGAIATVYLAEHPTAADRLILLAPMYRINTSPLPLFMVRIVAGGMTLFGGGASYLPGYGPYEAHPFENNPEHITSRLRFEERARIAGETAYRPGGVTAKGGLELVRLSAAGLKAAAKITVPALLVEAGRDRVVRIPAEDRAAARMTNCRTIVITDSGHVMMAESDPIRNQTVGAIRSFLERSAS